MAVLSNKPVNPSRRIVAGLNMGKFFFQVYGGNSFHTKKPDPFGALQLCQEAGVLPAEALMIGDSSNDILTGRNAGTWTIGRHLRACSPDPGDRAARHAHRFSRRTAAGAGTGLAFRP